MQYSAILCAGAPMRTGVDLFLANLHGCQLFSESIHSLQHFLLRAWQCLHIITPSLMLKVQWLSSGAGMEGLMHEVISDMSKSNQ